ncbi:MAG: sigma-54-dependent Fis family transcriptional regulator [Clostridia bacterium]|nr:sigma-54-dependent Fis family transcriptional regulator [Clostridia bacterium]
MKPIVWIIDDEQGICVSLSLALKKDYQVSTFNSAAPALERMKTESCDVVLLDLKLQEEDGMEVLRQIKQEHPDVSVIMMTAFGSIGSSVEAIKAGAYTYLTKPLDLEQLKLFLSQTMEIRKMNEQIRFLSDELRSRQTFQKIVGESDVMQRVYARINQVKDVDASVLITGESGTGKELVARAIHDEGKRKNERFVVVNCAAIPENLLELEFFGYRKGSFTGATQDRKGKLELADKGTIFLDEIGDMPLNLQGKLLRALQEKEFSPVGSSEVRHTDVRVIAATNQDLKAMIAQQKFRQDLYYRLNVVEITMPPLRDRMSDVPLLCAHFLHQSASEMNKDSKGLTPAAQEALMRYSYPGNVRQLANILEYATIISGNGLIDVDDLPDEVSGPQLQQEQPQALSEEFLATTSLKELERLAVIATLKKNNGRRDKTADDLGISKRGLLNKIKEYGIQ